MLVLTRKTDESIVINEEITVTIVASYRNRVKIGIDAPGDVAVHRKEVADSIVRRQVQQRAAESTPSLLVVSNDDRTQSALADMLADEASDVDVANSSACALEYATEKEYDFAIIDESLEKARGQELFERIKESQIHLKGILCTNEPTLDAIEAALDSGMDHVIHKPIDEAELLHLVKA